MLGQIVDWFYGQIVGFLGNFFSEMGGMGAELFEMSWVQSVVLFFSYLGWALFATGLVVACFECGVEYSGGRGNVKETALNAIKGFLAVSLFTQVPVRLYVLAVSLQADLTAGITALVDKDDVHCLSYDRRVRRVSPRQDGLYVPEGSLQHRRHLLAQRPQDRGGLKAIPPHRAAGVDRFGTSRFSGAHPSPPSQR